MSVYTEKLKLCSRDVDMFRRLRSSELFKLLQEASIRHTEELGMGRDKTLDRGILWVLLMQRAEIRRMPAYDEEIILKSWPGKTMHLLFPRYYSMETAAGEPLLKASALWSLVDAKTRNVTVWKLKVLSSEKKSSSPGLYKNGNAFTRRLLLCLTVL